MLDVNAPPVLPHRIQLIAKAAGVPVTPCVRNYISFGMFPVVMSCLEGINLLYDPIKPIVGFFFHDLNLLSFRNSVI